MDTYRWVGLYASVIVPLHCDLSTKHCGIASFSEIKGCDLMQKGPTVRDGFEAWVGL